LKLAKVRWANDGLDITFGKGLEDCFSKGWQGANERAGRGLALGRLDVLEDCEFGSRLGDDLVGKWRVKIERAGGAGVEYDSE
jgi:hypothetical protein